MPPTLADRLVHILESLNTVETLLAKTTFENFTNDLLARLAVERSFEIISEASRRTPDDGVIVIQPATLPHVFANCSAPRSDTAKMV